MEEVQLWRIDKEEGGSPRIASVEGVDETATEQLLEDVLTQSPNILMSGLTLVGRQNETAGGPLDLLGIDEDGRLVVFELKRGTLTRDAVAQVVDYASYLDTLETEELNRQITELSGRGGTVELDDFSAWYEESFQGSLSDIGRPRMVLVGLGVDERAKRMVEYLADANVDISLITFYGFRQDGQTFLARQVEVTAKDAERSSRSTKRSNQQQLESRLESFGLQKSYGELVSIVKDGLGESVYLWPNMSGYAFYLPEVTESGNVSGRAYLGLYVPDTYEKRRKLQIVLQQRVIETLGADRLAEIARRLQSSLDVKASGYGEIWIDLEQVLQGHKADLNALATSSYEAWQTRRGAAEHDSSEDSNPI